MKKRIIYFVIFLVSLLLYGNFISAQGTEKKLYEVAHATYIDSDGKRENSKDSFTVVFYGLDSVDIYNVTSSVTNHIDIFSKNESEIISIPGTNDSVVFYTYYARLNTKEPIQFGFVLNKFNKLISVGVNNEPKGYIVIFSLKQGEEYLEGIIKK